MRIAIGLEYDGSCFCGWQTQPAGCAVQNAVERALATIAGHPVGVVAAGRTDAGVHALAQVAHFDTEVERPLGAWVRGVNTWLPPGVTSLWAHPVATDFHARFSALGRRYRYVLLDHPVRPALLRGKAGWYHRPLDAECMHRAAQSVTGLHDFSAFRAAECQARTPCRTMYRASVVRRREFLLFEFHANGFLHHMVRNLVGSLIAIGEGKRPEAWLAQLVASKDRTLAAPTFAPDGLYFLGADYDAVWGLPRPTPRDPFDLLA